MPVHETKVAARRMSGRGPRVFGVIDVPVGRHHFDRVRPWRLEIVLRAEIAHHYRICRFAKIVHPPGWWRIVIRQVNKRELVQPV